MSSPFLGALTKVAILSACRRTLRATGAEARSVPDYLGERQGSIRSIEVIVQDGRPALEPGVVGSPDDAPSAFAQLCQASMVADAFLRF